MFDKIELLLTHTHTHKYIYIYIYFFLRLIPNFISGRVKKKQMI